MRELNRTGSQAGLHDDVALWRDNNATYVEPPRSVTSASEQAILRASAPNCP